LFAGFFTMGFAPPFSFLQQAFGETRQPGGQAPPLQGRLGFAEIGFVAANCFGRGVILPT